MAMDVLDNSPDNTANIIQHKFHGARCQQFGFIKNANGSYRIVTKTTNGTRCLAVQYALTTDGGNIFQYNYGSQANDHWWLIPTTVPQNENCFEMGIYATDEGAISGVAGGHAFLSFKNITSRYIQFGPIFLKPGEEMTLTKWWKKASNNTDTVHAGIWYNIDTSIKNISLQKYVYLTETIKGSALTQIVNYCESHDRYWLADDNCSTIAANIWNLFSSRKVYSTIIPNAVAAVHSPEFLKQDIIKYSYKTGKTFPLSTQIGYRNEYNCFIKCDIPKEK